MHNRAITFSVSIIVGLLWIALLTLLLPAGTDSVAADLLLDRNTQILPYPFTIQNVMWMIFAITAGELVVRHLEGGGEDDQLHLGLLPEDDETMLRRTDVGDVYRRVRDSDPAGKHWLQRLLSVTILQFQNSGSIDQVNAIFNSSMDLYQNETDLRYNMLRYLIWLIPTIGFIGTVIGIAFALRSAGAVFSGLGPDTDMADIAPGMMEQLTGELGVAFYTTLLALLQSSVLMLAMHLIQGREERALNRIGQYSLKNLINRLFERRS